MITSLKAGFDSPVSIAELGIHVDNPIDHLLDCHRRIERSLVTVQNAVAGLCSSAPVLRAEAGAALDYELALLQLLSRLHRQDEEQSLFLRLRRNISPISTRLTELMETCESQHCDEEVIFERLANCLRNFPAAGPQADERLVRMETLAEELSALCRPHIALENQLLEATLECLTPEDLLEMTQEIRKRFQA